MKSVLDYVNQGVHVGETWLINSTEYSIVSMGGADLQYRRDRRSEIYNATIQLFTDTLRHTNAKLIGYGHEIYS